ncbi:MAG: glycosyltransferase family 4 protein [Candidatus Scalindua sp.]|jgi:glycosyltransferase involved in cell wall biosynthesis|nr:glycosyltransferase family 4 protein [Candidatus Scalindua sp.]
MNIFYTACIDVNVDNADSRHVLEVCESFSRSGHNVSLFVPKIKKYRKKTDLKIIYVATPAKSVLLNYLLFYIFLIPYILVAYFKYKPDVLYSRYMASEIVITMIMKLLGCRYIAEVNGAFLDELRLKKSNSLLIKAVKIFENRLFNVADKIIVVTSGLKDYINCTFNIAIDKIAVVNNGVNTDISRPLDINKCKEELGLDKNRDYIVFVGSLRLWHGVNRLVEIVKYLSEKKDNICLLVVGSGPEEERLSKQISEASLTNKILMTGKVQHERVPLYIGSSLVCIAPYPDTVVSQHGFSSLKIREYMSCGRPIVTTNVGGLYEFVAENGCGTVVENNTDYEIAETILETINNKQEWQNISNTARRYATDNLSWDSAANNIISIINSSS